MVTLEKRTPFEVKPHIDPELAAHTKIFEKKIYKIGSNVYSAVGFGPANTIMVECEDCIVLLDVSRELETAMTAKQEFSKITTKPLKTIIYTHSHPDHIHGAKGWVTQEMAESGEVEIIAHETLLENLLGQSLLIGPILSARTRYTFGAYLKGGDVEGMNIAIGPRTPVGTFTFVAPTRTFKDRLELTIGGVEFQLFHVPSECPDEVAIYLPKEKILFSSEVEQGPTLPNIHPIRGAKFREPFDWIRSLDLLRSFKADHLVPHHGQPISGADKVEEVLRMTRDGIQFIHDQTVRYMNQGFTPDELAEKIEFPPHLKNYKPYLREYYGTIKASVREIYIGYLGWFEGDPVDLDPLPRRKRAERMIAMMGGRGKVLETALENYNAGEYQWAAELTTLLIRIDKQDMDARKIKAASFRQLGYDQININWRNWYLTSAKELDGSLDVTKAHLLPGQNFAAPDVVSALPARVNIEGLTVRLKAEETYDVEMILGFEFRGTNEHYALEIRRGITQFHETLPAGNYSVLEIDKGYLNKNPLNFVNLQKGKEEGKVGVKGNWDEVETFFSFFDFEPHPLWLTLR